MDQKYIETHLEEIPTYDSMGRTIAQAALNGTAWQLANGEKLGEFKYDAVVTVSEVQHTEAEIKLGWKPCLKVCVVIDTPVGEVKVCKHVP
jgi:hypothetical protein